MISRPTSNVFSRYVFVNSLCASMVGFLTHIGFTLTQTITLQAHHVRPFYTSNFRRVECNGHFA